MARGQVYVAKATYATELDGVPTMIYEGVTRARAGHELIERNPGLWEPVGDSVHYEVEQASAAPGEKRRGPTVNAADNKDD